MESESPTEEGLAAPPAGRPYHSKRPHRKSRTGCRNCKTRKVKCDEARPVCRACRLRREECVYPAPVQLPNSTAKMALVQRFYKEDEAPATISLVGLEQSDPIAFVYSSGYSPATFSQWDEFGLVPPVVREPVFRPINMDRVEMHLIWFYTQQTFSSFAVDPVRGRTPVLDHILKVNILRHAANNPFLMDCVLALTALHLQYLGQEIDQARAMAYRTRAFEGYRRAVEEARPETYDALLATSLLLCALSSQMFREKDPKPLFIIDWLVVWRGIGLIIEVIDMSTLYKSDLAELFNRPPIDLSTSALHIPGNLLFMIASIKEGDRDFPDVESYYLALKFLGSLYRELEQGFSLVLTLRIITMLTFMPKSFLTMARERRPRTLVILAHYLAFTKLVANVWWMEDISNREIDVIAGLLGDPWRDLMRVPLMANHIGDRHELARLLLGNHTWEPPRVELGREIPDPRLDSLTIVDDDGQPTAARLSRPSDLPSAEPAQPLTGDLGSRPYIYVRNDLR